MWTWLERLLYGPVAPMRGSALPAIISEAPTNVASPSMRSSMVFDSHVMPLEEAASGKNPQAISLAWDEGRAWGISLAPQSWLGMTPRERKETLLSIFIANPWASNCIDTIALYITSGGYTIEPRVENPDEKQHDEIEAFLRRINEDWDFNQFVYDQLTDEMIFGESFCEFTMKEAKPYQLFSIDCLTMDTEHDRYGRVVKYMQQLTSTMAAQDLDPKTIIRWWNPHKRAKVDPFSPLERIQDAILLDKKMINWMTTFFQKGAKHSYYFEGLGDQDEADRFLTYWRANYTGEKNAQTPPVLWGNAKIVPLGNAGPMDMDFDKGLDRMLTIVLSAFHVPPSIACIAESGNRLTDMSDGQRKILQYIACDPRRHRFFEKFNYRLIFPYFGNDYYVSTRYADFRDDKALAEVADIRVKNGTLTQNEVRQEMGKEAYKKGGDIPAIVTNKEVTPIERLDDLALEQRQTTQATLDKAQADADLAKTKAQQAKEPPPAPLQLAQQGKDDEKDTQGQDKTNTSQQKKSGKTTESESRSAGEEIVAGNAGGNESGRKTLSHPRSGRERGSDRRPRGVSMDTRLVAEESHEKQTTHPQGHGTNEVTARPHPRQSDEMLHPVQRTLTRDHRLHGTSRNGSNEVKESHDMTDEESSPSSTPQETTSQEDAASDDPTGDRRTDAQVSEADRRKAELAAWVASLFAVMKQRGSSLSPTQASALIAYAFTDQEREGLAYKLAEINLAAQRFAYNRDMDAVGITERIGIAWTTSDSLSWSHDQVASIAKTMHNQLGNFTAGLAPDVTDVASQVNPWLDRYAAWKAPQIANATWGTGANVGSMAAIEDMLDAASDPTQPGIVSTDNIRVRVVPASAKEKFCQAYAGHTYGLEEYQALGITWPAHPSCPHYIETFVVTGDDSSAVDDNAGEEL